MEALSPDEKPFTKGPFCQPAKIHPNSSFFLQGMAARFSKAALHAAQHDIPAKFHPFLFFAGCRGLVKQSSDAKEAREGHAAGKLLLSSRISG